MSSDPIWFGPADRPLFGWLHLPLDRRPRGAIILCTSLGTEATSAYRAMRLLALELEEAGFAVIRFDYPGTGDSVGEFSDDEQVSAWRAAPLEAIRLARSMGITHLGLLGLRIGATLAALTAPVEPFVRAVALWDPCVSGRTFVREQRALAALSLRRAGSGVNPSSLERDGGAELLGWVLGPKTRAELETLSLAGLRPPVPRCLVLPRDDRPAPRDLASWRAAPGVDWLPTGGQRELIDVLPSEAIVPKTASEQ